MKLSGYKLALNDIWRVACGLCGSYIGRMLIDCRGKIIVTSGLVRDHCKIWDVKKSL